MLMFLKSLKKTENDGMFSAIVQLMRKKYYVPYAESTGQ